ncbi:MAG: phosphoenolpyruvate synthase [Gammaproteobacteria bacterium]|nr:phosphoenolpyruvate synthase [Gammaproteobacteria bacterium]
MTYIKRFSEVGIDDVAIVGGKNASLGEMYSSLSKLGVKVPNGFAITAEAFRYYLTFNNLDEQIKNLITQLNVEDLDSLHDIGGKIRASIEYGEMPEDLRDQIISAYNELAEEYGMEKPDVAVRSSATAEDLPNASFAGQQESYLNIRGTRNLISTCKKVFASLYTDRAIAYRVHQGFDHTGVALSIAVQKMVRSDMASSGVMFTIDTETGFKNVVFITAAYGLGENVVQGTVNPDEYYVFKPALAKPNTLPIIKRQLGSKDLKMIYTGDHQAGMSTKNVPVHPEDQRSFTLSDEEIVTLARYAAIIEDHYCNKHNRYSPMDIEWAKDGVTNELFIVQARPETVQSQSNHLIHEVYELQVAADAKKIVAQGKSVGKKIASGKAKVILEAKDMHDLHDGEVLVTDITDPDWEPVMKRASAIVTNRGGRTCHAAIIARELGIPAIVGCGDATNRISEGEALTISCAEGDSGYVYEGLLPFKKHQIDLSGLATTRTKLMLNVGNPEIAFEASFLPSEGVGLARLEFIINNSIGIHPRALIEFDKLDEYTQYRIEKNMRGYTDPKAFYVEKLSEGVGTLVAAFHPRPVIVRLSDFKSNEYAAMIGGDRYEPDEENPMLGFRGASRYFAPEFTDCFALECQALKKVRDEMGLDNMILMVPFVRTVAEGKRVLELLAKNGLKRGENGLKVYLMCELPANALLADQFLDHFDGFSIGSNDLTQLTLGVDRDSGILTGYDERNDAVKALLVMAIEACNRRGKYVGICGQAPSDFPEFTEFLVEHNIQSISLNPDSLLEMKSIVLKTEQKMPHLAEVVNR